MAGLLERVNLHVFVVFLEIFCIKFIGTNSVNRKPSKTNKSKRYGISLLH